MIYGERIKQLRKEKKWSQDELANKIDADGRQVSRYERGKITPSVETLAKIAKAFEVTVDYLLVEEAPRKAFIIEDKELTKYINNFHLLTEEEKKCLYLIIESFLVKKKIKNFAQGIN